MWVKGRSSADFWRFAASFLVVAIHISPFEKINGELDFFFTAIAGRTAVPLFLMISGYYVIDGALKNKKVLIDYTIKIFKQYFFCVILYLPLNIYMEGIKIFEFSRIFLILKDFFIDGTFYHLWYFPALILGIWLSFLLIKGLGIGKALIIVSLLYLIGLFGDSYYGVIENNEVISGFYDWIFSVSDYTRNGLFYTPVFLCVGHFIKVGKETCKYDLMYVFLLFLLMTGEGMLLHFFEMQRHTSMYLFLVPLMFFLFRVIIGENARQNRVLRSMAGYIYIFHPMVIVAVRFAAKLIKAEGILVENNLVLYIAVCAVSAGVAGIICGIRVKQKRL